MATRGGRAAPEAPFVIEHREALIYMLCEAAELEHGIMCQYLFAAFSLKQSADEGLSDTEVAAVRRWRATVSQVATQEMLHLALVHNLLSAIGAAPHLARPNLPAPAGHYPAGVQLALLPFGEQALRHFMFLERPEGMDLEDADGLAAMGQAVPVMSERDIVPRGQDFATVGHLYRSIEAGITRLAAKHGENWLFVGPRRAQATQAHFGWPELVAVTDLASAQRAIDTILEQGEGPRGHWRNAHFGKFVAVLDEYQQLRAANPAFDPVRPVMAANVRPPERDAGVPLITDPLTARVTDLFNVGYEVLLQIFERFFAHTEETDTQLKTLADATIGLMLRVIKPLGDLITTLPVGAGYAGATAGPSFELFYETDYLMPHREAAWALLTERLAEAAWLCSEIRTGRGSGLAGQLAPVVTAIREITAMLAAHLPAESPHAALATGPAPLESATLAEMLATENGLLNAAAVPAAGTEATHQLAGLLRRVHAVVLAACQPGYDPGRQAVLLPRLINSAIRPLANAVAGPAPNGEDPAPDADSGPPLPATAGAGAPVEAPGAGSEAAEVLLWELTKAAAQLRVRLARDTGGAPPELAEACAALQDLTLHLASPAEREERLAQLWDLEAGLPTAIQTADNGPYLVTNLPQLISHLGLESRPAPELALCRCGQSAIKPLCDGSHASSGFTGAKDPKRVPDRRDTYPGQQLTVLDNRGICQHAGFCTDRLATVFRAGQEPFVAPSGGRMDEIIRAVRDCPSGALSYAFGGTEAREHVDWDNSRGPAVAVTKDGPYRIIGRIPLTGPGGSPVARSEGSSAEHYALCRCGHSQNKPFCSGMHWYVEFRDPVPAAGREPTLFEWAGGLGALTRMTRLFYERHVPADPLLAPLFANIPADQSRRLALWFAEALGGPALYSQDEGGYRQMAAAHAGVSIGEPQRARWVSLLTQAAQEAGLPGDPEFRSAFQSCIEWGSRAALAQSLTHTAAPPDSVIPRWDWGPAGRPPAATPGARQETQQDAGAAALPGPGETVSFAAHIRPLFRARDRQSMSFAFDLWSGSDVAARAADILRRLQDGSMPCDGAWPTEKIEVFKRWAETGTQP